MSKILEAMRKSSFPGSDLALRLTTSEGEKLFPPPAPHQEPEFEQLANALIHLHGGGGGQAVVFSSTVGGEGSSFISYNLARKLAMMLDRQIAWVDANFEHPQPRLQNPHVNFRRLLKNPAMFEGLETAGNLVLIPNGDDNVKTTELLQGNYPALLDRLQERFYFTVLDGPPIMESVDVARLAAPTLGVVVVVESRRLRHEIVKHAIDSLGTQRVRVVGTVLNKRRFDLPAFLYDRL